jgi:hypothetical protein
MDASAIRRPAHLVVELVRGELKSGKDVCGASDGAEHCPPRTARQLDVNPLCRLSGTSFLSDVDIDAIALAIELFQPFEPGLCTPAEPSANSRVVGPDDDIHLASSSRRCGTLTMPLDDGSG